jgi:hypothetical protein
MKSLIFGFMVITSEPLELDMGNFVWRQIITIPTNSVRNIVYKTIINLATVRNLEVMSDKFNVNIICAYVVSSKKYFVVVDDDDNNKNKNLQLQAPKSSNLTGIPF